MYVRVCHLQFKSEFCAVTLLSSYHSSVGTTKLFLFYHDLVFDSCWCFRMRFATSLLYYSSKTGFKIVLSHYLQGTSTFSFRAGNFSFPLAQCTRDQAYCLPTKSLKEQTKACPGQANPSWESSFFMSPETFNIIVCINI